MIHVNPKTFDNELKNYIPLYESLQCLSKQSSKQRSDLNGGLDFYFKSILPRACWGIKKNDHVGDDGTGYLSVTRRLKWLRVNYHWLNECLRPESSACRRETSPWPTSACGPLRGSSGTPRSRREHRRLGCELIVWRAPSSPPSPGTRLRVKQRALSKEGPSTYVVDGRVSRAHPQNDRG